MKRFIINILGFITLIVVVDFAYGLVCKYLVRNTHSGETARTAGLFLKNRYDIMIMGSSRCVCHYDDKLMSDSLGINVVNAGEKGNGIILMYGRYSLIPVNNKPKVLIYDVEPSFDVLAYENDDNNKRYLAGLKFYYDDQIIQNIFRDVDWREPLKMQSNLFRYNSNLFVIARDYLGHGEPTMSCYNPSYNRYVASTETKRNVHRDFDNTKLTYMEKMMVDTKRDGVHMIVVASPKYKAITMHQLQPIKDLCEKQGIPFWDYYLDLQDEKWFCNDMHLNYDGSQEFSQLIIQRIKIEKLVN